MAEREGVGWLRGRGGVRKWREGEGGESKERRMSGGREGGGGRREQRKRRMSGGREGGRRGENREGNVFGIRAVNKWNSKTWDLLFCPPWKDCPKNVHIILIMN